MTLKIMRQGTFVIVSMKDGTYVLGCVKSVSVCGKTKYLSYTVVTGAIADGKFSLFETSQPDDRVMEFTPRNPDIDVIGLMLALKSAAVGTTNSQVDAFYKCVPGSYGSRC
jgi:hypothetical protein